MAKWIYGRYKKKVVSGTLSRARKATTGFGRPRGRVVEGDTYPVWNESSNWIDQERPVSGRFYWFVFINDKHSGSLVLGRPCTTKEILESDEEYYTDIDFMQTVTNNTSTSAYRINKVVSCDRGDFVDTVIAEDGTYPDDGIQGDYWYVRTKRAFPEIKIVQNGVLKTAVQGYVVFNTPSVLS